MEISSTIAKSRLPIRPADRLPPAPAVDADPNTKADELRPVFDKFVGQTFFSQMLKAMRSTQDKPAYFHGGRGEEIFQQQFDQVLSEKLSSASADKLSGPMYELFTLGRK